VTSCTPFATDQTHYNCIGLGQNVAGCAPQPYNATTQASGTGQPIPGNNITMGTNTDNRTWCGFWADDPHHPRNLGNPCPDGGCKIGNPVNLATGNKFQIETDYAAAGEGSLEFSRTYNSFMPMADTGVGTGWNHSWSRHL
jgi:hypothetical protein